jgi:hypothetical protein
LSRADVRIGEVGTAIEVFSGQETTMTPSTAQQADPRVAELETAATDADHGSSGRDRRRSTRLPQEAVPGIGSVTLYPRDPAELLNISSSGLLVSCSRRLMPDSSAKFVLRCSDDEDVVVTGRVVRSKLVALGGDRGIAYETAIHADAAMDLQKYGADEVPVPVPPGANRREHERAQGPFDGTWSTPSGEMPIVVSNLSDGGCFVAQPNSVSPGDQLDLHIEVPNGDPIMTAAEVLSADPRQGFAVVFLDANAPATAIQPSATDPVAQRAAPETLDPTTQTDAPPTPVGVMANDW